MIGPTNKELRVSRFKHAGRTQVDWFSGMFTTNINLAALRPFEPYVIIAKKRPYY